MNNGENKNNFLEKVKNVSGKCFKGLKKGTKETCIIGHNLCKKEGTRSFLSSLICILIGLIFAFIVMLVVNPGASFEGLWTLISTGFNSPQNFSRVLYRATPMIFSGMAIAFAFKLNLFNIGITGQVTIGAFTSLIAGLGGANWFACLLVGMVVGAVAGFIPGFLKAKFGVNEVLSGIMLNWVIYYIIGLIGSLAVPREFKDKMSPSQLMVMPETGRMPTLGIPNMEQVTWGLVIAIVVVIIITLILNYTNFGFELKMTGRNKDASQYAGVNQSRSIILALTISGALAGICGYMLYADPTPSRFQWDSNANTLLNDGFNGISVSLIAQNSPIGCIFSSMVITAIDSAQAALKTVSDSYNIHYTELIKSVVIYLAALSSFIGMLLKRLNEKVDTFPYFKREKKITTVKEGGNK